jgi:hypothetical protein
VSPSQKIWRAHEQRTRFDRVTSRRPDDLDAFDEQLVKSFARAA